MNVELKLTTGAYAPPDAVRGDTRRFWWEPGDGTRYDLLVTIDEVYDHCYVSWLNAPKHGRSIKLVGLPDVYYLAEKLGFSFDEINEVSGVYSFLKKLQRPAPGRFWSFDAIDSLAFSALETR